MDGFGKRLRQLRNEKELTQKELAGILNLKSSATVSQYKTGDRIPEWPILLKLANLFDCSTDYLLGRSNYRATPTARAAHIASEGNISEEVLDQIEEILKKAREELKKGKG